MLSIDQCCQLFYYYYFQCFSLWGQNSPWFRLVPEPRLEDEGRSTKFLSDRLTKIVVLFAERNFLSSRWQRVPAVNLRLSQARRRKYQTQEFQRLRMNGITLLGSKCSPSGSVVEGLAHELRIQSLKLEIFPSGSFIVWFSSQKCMCWFT